MDRPLRGIDWEQKLQHVNLYDTEMAFTVGENCRPQSTDELYTCLNMQIAL